MTKDISDKIEEILPTKGLTPLMQHCLDNPNNGSVVDILHEFNREAKSELLTLIEEAEVEARIEELLWVARLDPDSNWKDDIDAHLQSIKQKEKK